MSQHAELQPHIKYLGSIYLKFTRIIDKKKESSEKVLNWKI